MKWLLDELVERGYGEWRFGEFKTFYNDRVVTDVMNSQLGDIIGCGGKVRFGQSSVFYDYPQINFIEVSEEDWKKLLPQMILEIKTVWTDILEKKKYWKVRRKCKLTFEEKGHWSTTDGGVVVNIDPYLMFKILACVAYFDKNFDYSYLQASVGFVIEHELTHLIEEHTEVMIPLSDLQREALNIMTDMDINLGLAFRNKCFSKVFMGFAL